MLDCTVEDIPIYNTKWLHSWRLKVIGRRKLFLLCDRTDLWCSFAISETPQFTTQSDYTANVWELPKERLFLWYHRKDFWWKDCQWYVKRHSNLLHKVTGYTADLWELYPSSIWGCFPAVANKNPTFAKIPTPSTVYSWSWKKTILRQHLELLSSCNKQNHLLELLQQVNTQLTLVGFFFLQATPGAAFQLQRVGFFVVDLDSTAKKPVFNRTVALK